MGPWGERVCAHLPASSIEMNTCCTHAERASAAITASIAMLTAAVQIIFCNFIACRPHALLLVLVFVFPAVWSRRSCQFSLVLSQPSSLAGSASLCPESLASLASLPCL